MMKWFRWRKVIFILCLAGCLVINGRAGDLPVCHAQQDMPDTAEQGETGGEGKQGMADSGSAACLAIDNQNVYEGMETSYAGGYVPKVQKEKAFLVLPLLSKKKLAHDQVTVSVTFGDAENVPFVYKNYEKTVSFGYYKTQKKAEKSGCYLISFVLKLKKERHNGSYPVTLSVGGEDEAGNEIRQEFTVYVTITDGKEAGADAVGEDGADDNSPQFAPKVIIDSYRFSKKAVLCGEKFTAKLTLRNTSRTDVVKNMLVSVVPGENVELVSKASADYVEELGAGAACTISFVFRVNAAAPRGQYNIDVTMDYADSRGNPYTLQGAMKVSAEQQVQIEIAPVSLPDKIQIGETVELQAQAMNLGRGKLYNVRAVVEAEGLTPSGTAFIGDMEPGTSMTGSMELTAEGLSGDTLYGTTQGKITFLYEDEAGNEMTQEQSFETSLLSPLSGADDDAPKDDTTQWWIIMAVIIVFIVQAAAILLMRRSRHVQMKEGEGV